MAAHAVCMYDFTKHFFWLCSKTWPTPYPALLNGTRIYDLTLINVALMLSFAYMYIHVYRAGLVNWQEGV